MVKVKKIKKILCPIDLSQYSLATIDYAVKFGDRYNVIPNLVYVSTKPPEVYYRFFPDAVSYLRSLEENVQNDIRNFTQTMEHDLKVTVRYGDIYREILTYAVEMAADLIIMQANSYSAIKDRKLGMVAHKVIRKAECPVLTLYDATSWHDVHSILCPLDLSSRSYEGLDQAVHLAEVYQAKLYVLHVIELDKYDAGGEPPDIQDEDYVKLSKHLRDEIKVPMRYKGVEIEKVISRNSDAAAGIVEFARQNEIDLIAITTHGHSYWSRMLLGSVTEKVIEVGPCPVLILRLRKGEGDE